MLAFPVVGQASERYYFSIPRKFGDNPTVQLSFDSPPIERGFLPTNWPGFETYNLTITLGTTLTLRADHPIVQRDDWGTLNFPTPDISLADSHWMQLFRQGAFGARSWTPINANTVQYTFNYPGEYHLDKDMLYRITVVQSVQPPTIPSDWHLVWSLGELWGYEYYFDRAPISSTGTDQLDTHTVEVGTTMFAVITNPNLPDSGGYRWPIAYTNWIDSNNQNYAARVVFNTAGNFIIDGGKFGAFNVIVVGTTPPTTQPPQQPSGTPQFTSPPSTTDNGVLLEFNTAPNNRFGYRIFRATTATGDGISITDFPIMVNPAHSLDRIITFDPNLRPNRDYWFYVREVIEEARFDPATATLTPEVLGPASARVHVRTSSNMTEPTAKRGFIMMFIGNPFMNVNNIWEGIDPPQNQTVPVINAGRTMVPVRAIVEAMGGTVGWTSATSQIDLRSHGNHVQMWLGQRDVRVNSASREMDIVPQVVNDRTLIPLRFVAEFLGAQVEWIGSQQMVVIVYELQ